MALFGVWDAAIVIFLVLVFAEYVKVRAKVSKQMNFIAGAGLLTVLAGASSWISFQGFELVSAGLGTLFSAIAWILLLVGTIWAAIELMKAK